MLGAKIMCTRRKNNWIFIINKSWQIILNRLTFPMIELLKSSISPIKDITNVYNYHIKSLKNDAKVIPIKMLNKMLPSTVFTQKQFV